MTKDTDSKLLACVIARVLDDKLGKDVSILNIGHVSSLADYFVLVTGDSTPQVKALMEAVKENIKKNFARSPVRIESDTKNRWNLLDYGDVVVHILHRDEREAYAIEKFWNNAYSILDDEWREISKDYSIYEESYKKERV
jgi:ribosome-associated protein